MNEMSRKVKKSKLDNITEIIVREMIIENINEVDHG